MELNKVYLSDCLVGMKELPDNSVDLVLTDPPYGYSFMGKDWDKAVPSVKIWKECFRVLKPGAFAFVMSAPRQDCLSKMICNLSEAGFNIGFTSIYWTYASGFPKAGDASKMADRKLGMERKIIGKNKNHRETNGGIGDGHFEGTFSKENAQPHTGDGSITAPASDEAKELEGWKLGFQPKPAVEVVIVAMKPLSEKNYIEQAMKNGKGCTNIDDCRIPSGGHTINGGGGGEGTGWGEKKEINEYRDGRFPANLLVSDDVLNDGIERKTGDFSQRGQSENTEQPCGWKTGNRNEKDFKGDSGSYSRYFSLDAWWDERLKELPESVRKTFPFIICPKASKGEKNKGCEELPEQERRTTGKGLTGKSGDRTGDGEYEEMEVGNNKMTNFHPTCKPLKLMSWLVTLGSRPSDIVLDPFMGSGTTAVASIRMKRNYIGFEMEKEYFEIIEARISEMKRTMELSNEKVQPKDEVPENKDTVDLMDLI